ncbi:hypothetical protein M076_0005 [Bacteroides fragilis str. 2-F-2 |nr:hypothetical protein M077_0005 [Bacteroides fragilis str. 2-F-2 \
MFYIITWGSYSAKHPHVITLYSLLYSSGLYPFSLVLYPIYPSFS